MPADYFLNKCLNGATSDEPWSHQIIEDTLPQDDFNTLRKECEQLDVPKDKLVVIHPEDFKDRKSVV